MVKVTKHKKYFPYSNVHGAFGILKVYKKKKKRILKKYIWVVVLRVKEVQTETEAQA